MFVIYLKGRIMPQDLSGNKTDMQKRLDEEGDTPLSLSYHEMQALLQRNRERVAKERKEFLDAWLAAPVRYNIK